MIKLGVLLSLSNLNLSLSSDLVIYMSGWKHHLLWYSLRLALDSFIYLVVSAGPTCTWAHFCAVEQFHPEFAEEELPQPQFPFPFSLTTGGRFKQKALRKLHTDGFGITQSRKEDLSFTLGTKKQTKAAIEVLQIFKRDLMVPACLEGTCKEELWVVIRHNWDCRIKT